MILEKVIELTLPSINVMLDPIALAIKPKNVFMDPRNLAWRKKKSA